MDCLVGLVIFAHFLHFWFCAIITVARDRDSDSERLLYFGRVITVARDSGRLLYFGRVIFYFKKIFFPSTKFSTSLGRFSRNFTTRRGMC